MKFPAKKDTTFSLPLLIPTGLALILSFWFLVQYRTPSAFLAVVASLLLFWGIYYFWTNTYYEIHQQRLHYRSGFLKGSIPINKITRVQIDNYPIAGNRPALAFTGLMIFYGSGNELYVSPIDTERFIQALKAANKKIKVKK